MKTTKETDIKVTINIRPAPVTPAVKNLYRRFWANLINQVKDELEREEQRFHYRL